MELQNTRFQQFRRQLTTNAVQKGYTKNEIIIICISIVLAFMAILAMILTATPTPQKTEEYYQLQSKAKINGFISMFQKPYECNDKTLKFQIKHQGKFWIYENAFLAVQLRNITCSDKITYVTHGGDLSFFHHIPEVAKKYNDWKSPISAALFAPGTDFKLTLTSIQYARNCIAESEYIKKFVTFHVFFPDKHVPTSVKMPRTANMALAWKFNCKMPAPYANLITIKRSYAKRMKLPYPVNVARNIARRTVTTYLILISDVIYIPALSDNWKYTQTELCIMTVPIFEWKLLLTKIPNLDNMQNYIKLGSAKPMKLSVPVYVSNNRVANYDERLYWEANEWHSKMQFYAKCLQGYVITNEPYLFMIYRPTTTVFQAVPVDSGVYIENTSTSILHIIKQEYLGLYGNYNEKHCEILLW